MAGKHSQLVKARHGTQRCRSQFAAIWRCRLFTRPPTPGLHPLPRPHPARPAGLAHLIIPASPVPRPRGECGGAGGSWGEPGRPLSPVEFVQQPLSRTRPRYWSVIATSVSPTYANGPTLPAGAHRPAPDPRTPVALVAGGMARFHAQLAGWPGAWRSGGAVCAVGSGRRGRSFLVAGRRIQRVPAGGAGGRGGTVRGEPGASSPCRCCWIAR